MDRHTGAQHARVASFRNALVVSWIGAALCLVSPARGLAQSAASRLLVTVVDQSGAPVSGLRDQDFTLRQSGAERPIVSVAPAPDAVQVAVLFEGLAASSQVVSQSITTFSSELSSDSELDVLTVAGDLVRAIREAVADLQSRDAPRPVVVVLGQAQSLRQSRVGLTIATGVAGDVEGDIDDIASLLVDTGTLLYGVSVTDVALDQLVSLAARSGGRFEVIASADEIIPTLQGIARELRGQYIVSYASPAADLSDLALSVDREGLSARIATIP